MMKHMYKSLKFYKKILREHAMNMAHVPAMPASSETGYLPGELNFIIPYEHKQNVYLCLVKM